MAEDTYSMTEVQKLLGYKSYDAFHKWLLGSDDPPPHRVIPLANGKTRRVFPRAEFDAWDKRHTVGKP